MKRRQCPLCTGRGTVHGAIWFCIVALLVMFATDQALQLVVRVAEWTR